MNNKLVILKKEILFTKNECNNINNFKKNIKSINFNFSLENNIFSIYGEFIQENNISYKSKIVKNIINDKASYYCEYCNNSIISERHDGCTHTNVILNELLEKLKNQIFDILFICKIYEQKSINFYEGVVAKSDNVSFLICQEEFIKNSIELFDINNFDKFDGKNSLKILKIKEFISIDNKDIEFYLKNIELYLFEKFEKNKGFIFKKSEYCQEPKIDFNTSLNKYSISNFENSIQNYICNFESNHILILEFEENVKFSLFSNNVFEKIKSFLNYTTSSSKSISKAMTYLIDNNLEKYINNHSSINDINLLHEKLINEWKYQIEIFDDNDEKVSIKIFFKLENLNHIVTFDKNENWILLFDPTLYYDIQEIKNISKLSNDTFKMENNENVEKLESIIKKLNRSKKIDLLIESKYVTSSNKKQILFNVSFKNNICKLEFTNHDYSNEEIAEILEKYKDQKNMIKLSNNKIINILNLDIKKLEQDLNNIGIDIEGIIKNNFYINNEMTFFLNSKFNNVEISEYVNKFNNYIPKIKIDESIWNILKEHQKTGSNWILKMFENNFGCLVADDMGVGKTLQAISVLDALQRCNTSSKSIIVCPLSLVYNWKNEIEKYSSFLKPIEVIGTKKERENIFKDGNYNVFIISYSSLSKDIDYIKEKDFLISILDESQFIKNSNSLNYKSVKLLKSKYRLALTGTPIENNLNELWSIFNYITPGLLGDKKSFNKKFVTENNNSLNILKDIIKPFYIRREKKDVLESLPKKNVTIVSTKFNEKEQEEYESIRKEAISFILNNDSNLTTFQKNSYMFKKLTEMRIFCCKGNINSISSSKLELCISLINEIIDRSDNEKIIIFSQFTTVLDFIANHLKENNLKFEMLTGSDKVNERLKKIESYSNSNDIKIFLISLKAGGVGLNITAANNVIHFDPWWNIAVENQATDRSYRLGQKRNVNVYKLIVENTIEEKIINLQNEKTDLFNNIISNKNENELNIELFKKIINFPNF